MYLQIPSRLYSVYGALGNGATSPRSLGYFSNQAWSESTQSPLVREYVRVLSEMWTTGWHQSDCTQRCRRDNRFASNDQQDAAECPCFWSAQCRPSFATPAIEDMMHGTESMLTCSRCVFIVVSKAPQALLHPRSTKQPPGKHSHCGTNPSAILENMARYDVGSGRQEKGMDLGPARLICDRGGVAGNDHHVPGGLNGDLHIHEQRQREAHQSADACPDRHGLFAVVPTPQEPRFVGPHVLVEAVGPRTTIRRSILLLHGPAYRRQSKRQVGVLSGAKFRPPSCR